MFFSSKLIQSSKIKSDSSMGIMLAVFFGLGIFLLSLIQKKNIPGKAGLNDYIFGSASTLTHNDVNLIAIFGSVTLVILLLLWKEFKIHTFDSAYTNSLGFNSKILDILLVASIVTSIIIGLQAVGVILMVAMIVAPAASARQWTDNLSAMVLISAFFWRYFGHIRSIDFGIGQSFTHGTCYCVDTHADICSINIILTQARFGS